MICINGIKKNKKYINTLVKHEETVEQQRVLKNKTKLKQSELFILFLRDLNLKRNMWHAANSKLAWEIRFKAKSDIS